MRVFLGTLHRDGTTVELDASARMRHFVLLGKSGVGKSTLLRNMIIADLCSGVGLTCIDPNGDLIDDILSVIPAWRVKDVIYFDPLHPEKTLGLNIVESVRPEQRALMVSHVVSIFKHIWKDSWGPRMEDILRNALFVLIEQREPVSLVSLPKLLQNRAYRQQLLANVGNPVVRDFFELDYERWDKGFKEQAISPVLNKVRAFLSDPAVMHIIGQKRSSFDVRWAMDTGKVLFISIPKGTLGADVSKLLGSLLVTKIALASLSRQDTAKERRVPHALYIDEAHNFGLGVDYETILAEARKFALGLILASQTLSQFSENAVAAMFGNASTIASYRVSHDDAHQLVRNFAVSGEGPKTAEQTFDMVLPPSELQRLPDYSFYLQTLRDGRPHDPVLVNGFPPLSPEDMRRMWSDKGRVATKEEVIRRSLERYGRDRQAVESDIKRFLLAA